MNGTPAPPRLIGDQIRMQIGNRPAWELFGLAQAEDGAIARNSFITAALQRFCRQRRRRYDGQAALYLAGAAQRVFLKSFVNFPGFEVQASPDLMVHLGNVNGTVHWYFAKFKGLKVRRLFRSGSAMSRLNRQPN